MIFKFPRAFGALPMAASIRLRVDRLEKELGFTWKHPDYKEGLAASCAS